MEEVKPKRKKNVYFTQETEDAIVEYNNSDDIEYKNKLYTDKIHPAFYKLAEIMIHRFKFYNFDVPHEDVKYEVISFLHEKMDKYKQESGKAFSYFSIVAKNYLIAENNKNYYQYKKKDVVENIDVERNVVNEVLRRDFVEEQRDFFDMFIEVMDYYLASIFPKTRDLGIADSVMYLFRTRDNIENYNKKALYILIKERTGAKSQYITAVIKKIKEIYERLYMEYDEGKDITQLSWDRMQEIIDG